MTGSALRGAVAYYGGLAAEEQVAAQYRRSGVEISAHRWRGRYGGEIDLIARQGDTLIFIEVKRSSDHRRAAARLSSRQIRRIGISAQEYASELQDGAQMQMRFDVALVDGAGRIEILQNACLFD